MAAPVVLRIKLRYDDVEALVQKFAINAGKSGLFLPTKSMQPIGTELKFELRLANDTPVLVGMGCVRAVREPDPANPKATCGLSVELLRVTKEGREVILRMLERRRALGLPDVAVPMPEDVDAAKRAEGNTTSLREQNYAARTLPPEPAAPPPGDALLTSPRPTTAVGRVKRDSAIVILPLAAEPSRRARPAVGEVIARAIERSGALAAAIVVPGLDEDVDIGRAMARARVLAASAGDVDAELEALREAHAAPLVEISVEAASAELARQLGGAPVRRDRSAGWAPPPSIAPPPPPEPPPIVVKAPEPEPEPEPEPIAVEPEPAAPEAVVGPVSLPVEAEADVEVESAPVYAPELDSAPVHASPEPFEEEEIVAEAQVESEAEVEAAPELEVTPGAMIHDDVDPDDVIRAVSPPVPLLDADELRADDDDFDEDDRGESTHVGDMPILDGYDVQPAAHEYVNDFAEEPRPAQYAYAEEAVAEEAIAEEALAEEAIPEAIPEAIEEIEDYEILAEAEADDAEQLLADGEAVPEPIEAELPPEPATEAPEDYELEAAQDDEAEPPQDGTRVAARTAIVGDLAAAHRRPATNDFDFDALDLGDDARARSQADEADFGELASPRDASSGYQLAAYQVPESAEDAGFDRPESYPGAHDLAAYEASSYHGAAIAIDPVDAVELDTPSRVNRPYDLDSALDDLGGFDVELEGGSVHHRHARAPSTQPARAPSRGRPASEGVMIDFDNDFDDDDPPKR